MKSVIRPNDFLVFRADGGVEEARPRVANAGVERCGSKVDVPGRFDRRVLPLGRRLVPSRGTEANPVPRVHPTRPLGLPLRPSPGPSSNA